MLKEAGTAQNRAVSVRQLFDLTGRVAIVTGGSIGLGRQMAAGLAEMGANLVLCARKAERCQQAADELRRLGVRAIAAASGVKSQASIQGVVGAALAEFGRIDVLINNAGISWGSPAEEMSLEDWNKVIETNLTGTFLCAQAVGRVMLKQGRGKIINIASVAGLGGAPPERPALAGSFSCRIFRCGGLARRTICKGAAVYLASDASNYVTSHVLVVDGGQSVRVVGRPIP